jgi:hypothetical protein
MAEGVVRSGSKGQVAGATSKTAPPQSDLWAQAQQQYPILSTLGLQFKMNPQSNQKFLEFWPEREPGTPAKPIIPIKIISNNLSLLFA